ncbi:MAG TPA: hypothetical protein DCL86_09945 [Bacteroidales bacterium]|jgi:hypothetical protein|nr:hypothetical protein [Bacteroidales bacterium]
MGKSQAKRTGYVITISIIITYIIVKIVYKLTGFYYNFDEGLLNIKLLIDLSLWAVVFIAVNFLVKMVFHKRIK